MTKYPYRRHSAIVAITRAPAKERTVRGLTLLLLTAAALVWMASAHAAQKISLYALFENKAIIMVDGQRRMLTVGGEASPEGIKLLSTDTETETASVEIAGKEEKLKLGVIISGFQSAAGQTVVLYVESDGQFHADGTINDLPVRFLVDTGATSIALNSQTATRVGLDYKRLGQPSFARTASGVVPMYTVTLTKVTVGTITLHNVDAGIIEGSFPTEALLGMSFLNRLKMKRDGDTLELTQHY